MNTIDLALELELMMMPSEESDLELTSSDFDLLKHQITECVLANFVDFRGISNPKRWAIDKTTALPQPLYEYTYLEYPPYQDPPSNVDDHASTNLISESYLENN